MSKSILIALTFFVIGNFVIIGLGVSNAASEAKVKTRMSMRAVVSYEMDYWAYNDYVSELPEDERNEAWQNEPTITEEEVKKFMSDSRVKTFNALSVRDIYGDYEAISLGNDHEIGSGSISVIGVEGSESRITYSQPKGMAKTNIIPDMIELSEGTITVTSGRFYTQEDIDNERLVCLVSEELAELNNFRVGDTIRLDFYNKDDISYYDGFLTEENIGADFEIIGIYNTKEVENPVLISYQNPKNTIYMPSSAYAVVDYEIQSALWNYLTAEYPEDEYYQNNKPEKGNLWRSSIILLLNDPMDVEDFVAEYSAKTETYPFRIFNANNEMFDKLARPLDTLSLFAAFIVGLVILNAIVIITLVTALTLKTREYEIGVLLSVGVSKIKIIAQLFLELAIVAMIAFTLAVVTGSLVAKQVGAKVLDYQIDSSGLKEENNNSDHWIGGWGDPEDYFTDVSLDDIVERYEVSISLPIIAEIYLAGLGIVFISILVPSAMIMRFNPKRILMNTN